MEYVVGLTATDGCLTHGRRRSINFKSEDFELVSHYLALLGRTNTIGVELTREGNVVYHTQFGDARLYEWFRSVGLMPRKSLVLGAIDVPDSNVSHLVRGLLDGDGSILNYMYEVTGKQGARTKHSATVDDRNWGSGDRSGRISRATGSIRCIGSRTRTTSRLASCRGCIRDSTFRACSESESSGIPTQRAMNSTAR